MEGVQGHEKLNMVEKVGIIKKLLLSCNELKCGSGCVIRPRRRRHQLINLDFRQVEAAFCRRLHFSF
jgi:hypothetical protein